MFFKIQPGNFFFGCDPEAYGGLDCFKYDESCNGYVQNNRGYAGDLCEEEVRVAAVEPAFFFRQ